MFDVRTINFVLLFSVTKIPPRVHLRTRSWSPEELGLGGQKVKLPHPGSWRAGVPSAVGVPGARPFIKGLPVLAAHKTHPGRY